MDKSYRPISQRKEKFFSAWVILSVSKIFYSLFGFIYKYLFFFMFLLNRWLNKILSMGAEQLNSDKNIQLLV